MDDLIGLIVDKFPAFDPGWPEATKASWLDAFARIVTAARATPAPPPPRPAEKESQAAARRIGRPRKQKGDSAPAEASAPLKMSRSERGRMGGQARWARAKAEGAPVKARFVCKWCGNPIAQKDQPLMIDIDGFKYHDKCAVQKDDIQEHEKKEQQTQRAERAPRADFIR